jgi:Na+/alanine symporter
MYYITNGLGKNWKWLAVIFAVFGTFASFGMEAPEPYSGCGLQQ